MGDSQSNHGPLPGNIEAVPSSSCGDGVALTIDCCVTTIQGVGLQAVLIPVMVRLVGDEDARVLCFGGQPKAICCR